MNLSAVNYKWHGVNLNIKLDTAWICRAPVITEVNGDVKNSILKGVKDSKIYSIIKSKIYMIKENWCKRIQNKIIIQLDIGWAFCFTAYQPFSGHLTPSFW